MPILATVGNHLSQLLHSLIYAFPSPTNSTLANVQLDSSKSLVDLISEPGEPKALAGGIGPLSFAGSGYGVMLVIMVS